MSVFEEAFKEGSMRRVIDIVKVETPEELAKRLQQDPNSSRFAKVSLDEAGVGRLLTFTGPLFIIGIAGRARKGKSTLGNLIILHLMKVSGAYTEQEIEEVRAITHARMLNGKEVRSFGPFQTGIGTEPVTQGIQMWGEAIPRQGGGSYVVFDTEGTELGSDVLTAMLTAITALFSSILVYNVKGGGGVENRDLQCLASLRDHEDIETPETFTEEMEVAAQGLFSSLCVVAQGMKLDTLEVLGLAARGPSHDWNLSLGSPDAKKKLKDHLEGWLSPKSPDDSFNASRSTISSCFEDRSMVVTTAADEDDRKLLRESRLSDDGLFSCSMREVLHHIQQSAASHPLGDDPKDLVAALRPSISRINECVVDIPSVVFFAQTVQLKKIIADIFRGVEEKFLTLTSVEHFDVQAQEIKTAARTELSAILDRKKFVHLAKEQGLNRFDMNFMARSSIKRQSLYQERVAELERQAKRLETEAGENREEIKKVTAEAEKAREAIAEAERQIKAAEERVKALEEQLRRDREALAHAQRNCGKSRSRCSLM